MPQTATVRIDTTQPAAMPLTKYLTGKFCEHLGSNIYNGMSAQIVRNPTFARYEFGAHAGDHPDGGARYECDTEQIHARIRESAQREKRSDGEARFEAWQGGLAYPWIREGAAEVVRVSPDVSGHGRAQRVEVSAANAGIAQVFALPVHRCRSYVCRLMLRSPQGTSVGLRLVSAAAGFVAAGTTALAASGPIAAGPEFAEHAVTLTLPESLPAIGQFRLALVFLKPGEAVVARIELFPADAMDEADPDVVRMLKESRLPILRWPGGNFVSGYNWRDGIGPRESRPGRTNPAWGGVESNLFGLHEFIAFCKNVGCEPMLCVNAGTGTPEEAADWVEYCNGSSRTPLGKLRKINGHAKPFGIRFWEVGNELTGEHQINWTTPAGYADRFGRFAKAMLARDPSIVLPGCGAPVDWKEDWNLRLFRAYPQVMPWITDHILRGGSVPATTDPYALFQSFMTLPVWFEGQYRRMEGEMRSAGIAEPRLAITELQLFGRIASGSGAGPLTNETMVSPDTLAEAIYDVLFYHMAVRLAPYVGMITHSATVNHGGGLRKQAETVYANPCHHAQALFADFNGSSALPVQLHCANYQVAGIVRKDMENVPIPVIDAVAARTVKGRVVVSLVNRGLEAQAVTLTLAGATAKSASVTQLAAKEPWARNSLENQANVVPVQSRVALKDGIAQVTLPPWSITHLVVK
ncbi:MAG TPA: alpha-L-arabinofuranosidase C-terminal domain-containing protein [Planctomycetota bacterium]|nr:alpha-L-arabinofuranosidase C-terminal domain-containing protein [Planctomycetota bacterium]